MTRRLTKGERGIIAGVCSGIAEYFDQDPTLIRIIFIVLCFFGGTALLVYVVCWLIMPRPEKAAIRQRRERVVNARNKNGQ